MPRVIIKSIFLAFLVTLLFASVGLTQSSVTISTYYPSPYGVYDELRARRMAIGPTWYDRSTIAINANADLIVERRLGIGTSSPAYPLQVQGDISVQGGGNYRLVNESFVSWDGTRFAWASGAESYFIQNVGFGSVTDPSEDVHAGTDIRANEDLHAGDDVYVGDDIWFGSNGIIVLVTYTAGGGAVNCPTGYYAVGALTAADALPTSGGWLYLPSAGKLVCIKHN